MTDAYAHSIDEAAKMSGLGKTKLYELIGSGRIEARKAGSRTLVMADSLRAYLASLPIADIRMGQPRHAA